MSATRRFAAAGGLLLAAAVAAWWLGTTRQALLDGADASRPAAQALLALGLLRGIALALTAPAEGLRRGWFTAAGVAALWVAPGWPLAVLAWSASSVPLGAALSLEAALLAAALALPALGAAHRRLPLPTAWAEPAALALGVMLAAALWQLRAALAAWLG